MSSFVRGMARPQSATTTTGNSSPLAPWMVISRTASPPSSSIVGASPSRAPAAAWASAKARKPARSGPRRASYSRARRTSLRTLA